MKIILKHLSLLNFKGIRSLDIPFQLPVTNLFGENASGKTTVMDAFLWLLFNKDSTDRKDFEIKTLDENNRPLHRLDHQVTAILTADSEEITISKVYREKWSKKKGNSEKEFTGHETTYLWNDVPCNENEFKAKVGAILQESTFKILTNTGYFNSLKWQDRRNTLLAVAGEINNNEVLDGIVTSKNKESFAALIAVLNSRKTLDEYKREIYGKKKVIKDELILIPSRIDEAKRSLPDDLNYQALEIALKESIADLLTVEGLLMNKSKAQKERQELMIGIQKKIHTVQTEVNELEFKIRNTVLEKKASRVKDINEAKRELRLLTDSVDEVIRDISTANLRKEKLEKEKTDLLAKWHEVNNSQLAQPEELVFDDKDFCCPTCKREYEAADVESKKAEMIANFNENNDKSRKAFNDKKVKDLADISAKGKTAAAEFKIEEAKINNLSDQLSTRQNAYSEKLTAVGELEQNHERLSKNEELEIVRAIANDPDRLKLKTSIETLESEAATIETVEVNSDLLQKKQVISIAIDNFKEQLGKKELKEKTMARITELTNQEKEMSASLADLEGIEFTIQQFQQAKMDTLQSRINGMFKMVTFKMFREQINGGVEECCDTLINGVPYADANNAAKIQAGIDIINALSDFYDVKAPIFIDNRESVTTIPDTDNQVINLIVMPGQKKLKIEHSGRLAEVA